MAWRRISDPCWQVRVRASDVEQLEPGNVKTLCVQATNFVKLFSCELSRDQALAENENLNKLVFEPPLILGWICKTIEDSDPDKFTLGTVTDDHVEIRFSTVIVSGVSEHPFKWIFHLKRNSDEEMYRVVVKPQAQLMHILLRRQEALFKQLVAKDDQILELEASGGKLSSKKFKTQPFDRASFLEEDKLDQKNVGKEFLVGLHVGDCPLVDEHLVARLNAVVEIEDDKGQDAKNRYQDGEEEERKPKSPVKRKIEIASSENEDPVVHRHRVKEERQKGLPPPKPHEVKL